MQNSKPRILIVDDEPNNIRLLEALLESEGYLTQVASSGLEGLGKAQAWYPDIILLDIMMPEINGFEVCKRLRADPILQTVAIQRFPLL